MLVVLSATSEARALPYVEALKAGGVPGGAIRVVTPESAATGAAVSGPALAGVRELASRAAGLLLCGGHDVHPERYGEEPLAGAGLELLPERDALEWELLAVARERRLPVWGVCRGFQVLNVFLGGSLWQDLPLQRPGPVAHERCQPRDLLAHGLRLPDPGAPLARHLAAAAGGTGEIGGRGGTGGIGGGAPLVNSLHHQGVKRLGRGLLAVAEAPDGLVEAFVLVDGGAAEGGAPEDTAHVTSEHPEISEHSDSTGWWLRGVEWHPENLLALPEQLALWQDFAAAVAGWHGRQAPAAGRAAGQTATTAPPP